MNRVVVIGGGGSGLRAALAAAEAGASVDLFEKNEDPGGKTAMSIGIMTASQSSFQRRAGIDDTHEAHLNDIRTLVHESGKQIADESMIRFILEQSAREVEELAELGVRFSGPHPEGAHHTPRMHVIQPDCRELARVLIDACEGAGVRIHTSSPGSELIFENGRVRGAVAGKRRVGSRRGRARCRRLQRRSRLHPARSAERTARAGLSQLRIRRRTPHGHARRRSHAQHVLDQHAASALSQLAARRAVAEAVRRGARS